MVRIALLLMWLLPGFLAAQVLSNKGRFSVDHSVGCAPFTVNVNELDTFGNVSRQYYYEGRSTITNETVYTYDTAGLYYLEQLIGKDSIGDKLDTLIIEVVAPIRPSLRIEKCSDLEIIITSTDGYYDSIALSIESASYRLGVNESVTHTFQNFGNKTIRTQGLLNGGNMNCRTFDEVIELTDTTPAVSSSSLQEVCSDDYFLDLTVVGFDTLSNYRIVLLGETEELLYEGTVNSSYLRFNNISFPNGLPNTYCLRIDELNNCFGNIITGNEACFESSPLSQSPFEQLYASYTGEGVYLNLDTLRSGQYDIYRGFSADALSFRTTAEGPFTDRNASLTRPYYYRVDYLDSCRQFLATVTTNPPIINGRRIEENFFQIDITPPVNQLGSINATGYAIGTNRNTSNFLLATTDPFEVRLNAADGMENQSVQVTFSYENAVSVWSNEVILRYTPIVYAPTAFTPNSDGVNDLFELFGLGDASEIELHIYNRWSNLIYSANEATWDGTINGELAPADTYLYEIVFSLSNGKRQTQRGTFALLKK